MPFHCNGEPTQLQPGDVIRFHTQYHQLSMGRQGNRICPSVVNNEDDKFLWDLIQDEKDFAKLGLLLANAAGLDIADRTPQRKGDHWTLTVSAPSEEK